MDVCMDSELLGRAAWVVGAVGLGALALWEQSGCGRGGQSGFEVVGLWDQPGCTGIRVV